MDDHTHECFHVVTALHHVFCDSDPAKVDPKISARKVALIMNPAEVGKWNDGVDSPPPQVLGEKGGVYRIFSTDKERLDSGFMLTEPYLEPICVETWQQVG